MRKTILLILIASISGCASMIMKGYIGKDVREVVVEYGYPSNWLDMGDGRRAFMWTSYRNFTTPVNVSSYTTGQANAQVYGNTVSAQGSANTNTRITGGQTYTSSCLYTLYAKWDDVRKGWIVTDFVKPKFRCE